MAIEQDIRTVFSRLPRNLNELEKKKIDEILIIAGGGFAIFFSFVVLILEIIGSFGSEAPGPHIASAIARLIICLVFGFGLLYTYAFMVERPKTSIILGFICSIALFFGGYAGTIGGLLGFIGIAIFFLRWQKLI